MASALPFRSFFMGGFECSPHRRKDGVRLDLIRGTGHDAHALSDYRACAARGLATVRDGLRWHRIEATSGVYDWSSWAPMVEAAAEAGVQVIWDMLHYGCPDYRDAAHPDFVTAFARFAAEAVRLHRSLTGRTEPELGGAPDIVDAIGLKHYPENQWYHGGSMIPMGHHGYRPLADMLADMLAEVSQRYDKPIFISETGAEGSGRPAWLHHVCDEVREAMQRGVPVRGICLYPIATYPGWNDSRHAPVGLFTTPGPDGERAIYEPLAAELARQQQLFAPGDGQ